MQIRKLNTGPALPGTKRAELRSYCTTAQVHLGYGQVRGHWQSSLKQDRRDTSLFARLKPSTLVSEPKHVVSLFFLSESLTMVQILSILV